MTDDCRPTTGDSRALSVHARWRCRHSGACCRAGWAIPIEAPAFERVRLHFGARKDRLFKTGGPLPEGAAAILGTEGGACVFLDEEDGRLCAIHRDLGADALPVACRQFPRQALHDRRGAIITLSHYCPTAAALLIDRPSLEIVEAPGHLRLDDRLEGLDALEALPPLLTDDMLTDLPGYDAWERAALRVLTTHAGSAAEAVEAIGLATGRAAAWRPGQGDLAQAVAAAFTDLSVRLPDSTPEDDVRRMGMAIAAVPRGLRAPEMAPLASAGRPAWNQASAVLEAYDAGVRTYLGARLFGNWIAYYGHGLATVVEYLRICHAVLRLEAVRARDAAAGAREQIIEAFRASDWLLVHLVDARALVSRIEKSSSG
jgi:Fe-S-cluster containining protein